eukprot:5669180-Amphidinium_carterae.2
MESKWRETFKQTCKTSLLRARSCCKKASVGVNSWIREIEIEDTCLQKAKEKRASGEYAEMCATSYRD